MDLVLLRRRMRRPRQSGGLQALRFAFVGLSAFLFSGVMFALLAVVSAYGLYSSYIQELPSADEIGLASAQQFETTRLYDRTGQVVLYEVIAPEGHRTAVPLERIPQYLRDATVAMEDRTFYTNPGGINIRGLGRAVWGVLRGEDEGGGSSITQQLVRNVIMTYEERIKRSYARKLKELVLSYELTERYPGKEGRDTILEWYLNSIPYGRMAVGVEAAAQIYFSKSVEDLTLAEATMLVHLPNSPTLNPIDAPEQAKKRQEMVLDEMYLQGYLTADEAWAAKQEEIVVTPYDATIVAPYFTVYALEQLGRLYGPEMVYGGGLQVITSVDLEVQEQVQSFVREHIDSIRGKHNAQSAATVVIDTKTGELVAMVGGVDYYAGGSGQVNVAVTPRQPGSSFKPIVYATAFIQGYTPASMVMDVRTSFPDPPNAPYVPENYSLGYAGPVTLRRALACSYNIPAVAMLQNAGIQNVLDTAHRMGITDLKPSDLPPPLTDYTLSLALGGFPVKVLDMAYAFTAFANGGNLLGMPAPAAQQEAGLRSVDPAVILEVRDAQGNLLFGQDEPQRAQAIRPEVAFLVTDILSDNAARTPAFGANSVINLPDRPAAVKTGTTQFYTDGWAVGYTPQYSVAVWVGDPDGEEVMNTAGVTVAGPLWRRIMNYLHEGLPVEGFSRPPGLVSVVVDTTSGLLPTEYSPSRSQELFVEGSEPSETDNVHQPYSICMESGQLATPYCPRGSVHTRVYSVYPPEAADWMRETGVAQPPRRHCPIHGPSLAAVPVAITGPTLYERVKGTVPITGNAAPGGFERYWLQYGPGMAPTQWTRIGGDHTNPVGNDVLDFWDTSGLSGLYTLQLNVAAAGGVQQFAVQVLVDGTPPALSLLSPYNGQRISRSQQDYINIQVSAVDDTAMDRVEFYGNGQFLGYSTVAPYTKRWMLSSSGSTPEHDFDLEGVVEEPRGDELHRREVVMEGDRQVHIHTVHRDGQVIRTERVSRGPDGGIAWVVLGPDGQVLSSSEGGGGATRSIYVVAYDQAGNRVQSPTIEVQIVR